LEETRRALSTKVDAIELQKWNLQRAKQGVTADTEEFIEDRLRSERNKNKDYFSDLEKIISSKASKEDLLSKIDRAEAISHKQWANLEKKFEDNINVVVEEQDIKIKDLELRTSDLQGTPASI
jgi:hypothetical protein